MSGRFYILSEQIYLENNSHLLASYKKPYKLCTEVCVNVL